MLIKNFNISKDEFSSDNLIWYTPKSAPKFINQNAIYCYFSTKNGRPKALIFKIQYYAEDWLFFEKIQFAIDEQAYEYIPSKTERDNGGGYIWEWSEEAVTESDKELINALANAKQAKMKFIGHQYAKVRNITKNQIDAIRQTVDLFIAMGGQY